jgi:hypothetical protein
MKDSIVIKIVLIVVIIAAVAGLGAVAFRAGLAQGTAVQLALPGGAGETARLPYAMPYGYHHFGGFGFFSILVPLFLFLILFGAVRRLFWGSCYRGWHHMRFSPWGMKHGNWDREMGVPPFVEEWHRQMHEGPSDKTEEKQ